MKLTDQFDWGRRTYVMGILNVTPDSFSGDGLLAGDDGAARAVERAREFLSGGADILDIGGESSRPGGDRVPVAVERDRVLPVIEAILEAFPDAVVSIDTYRAAVAEAAVSAGAQIINDIWALAADPELGAFAADNDVPVVLMHNRSRRGAVVFEDGVGGRYQGAEYDHVVDDVKRDLGDRLNAALEAGIDEAQIILDPGFGFGKSPGGNMALLNHLGAFKSLGRPLLIGPSRKSFIGKALDLPVEDRGAGTAAAIAVGIARGADIVRVHDVAEMAVVARMTDAILRTGADGHSADGQEAS